MVGWHHWLNGHEFEQTPGDSEGQGSLACYSPWGHKELNTTELLNNIYILKNNIGGGKGINIHQQKKGDHLQICVWFLFALSNLKPLLLLLPSLVKKKSVGFQTLSRTPPIISLLLDGVFYKCRLDLVVGGVLRSSIILLIIGPIILISGEGEVVEVIKCNYGFVYLFFEFYQFLFHMFYTLFFDSCTFRNTVSSW